MSNPTKQQVAAAFQITAAVAETIREVGQIPNGHLYAMLMGKMDFEAYTKLIGVLKGAGLVAERSDVLTWVGPKVSA